MTNRQVNPSKCCINSDHVVQNLFCDCFSVEHYNRYDHFHLIRPHALSDHIFSLPRQAWSFLSHLPVLEVQISMKGWWEDSQEQTEHRLPAAGANLREERSWLDVHADQEYVLQVSLRRINTGQQRVSMCKPELSFLSSHCDVSK